MFVDDSSHWLKRNDISPWSAGFEPVSSSDTSLSGCTWVNKEGSLWVRHTSMGFTIL